MPTPKDNPDPQAWVRRQLSETDIPDPPENAQANLAQQMTEGEPDMGRKGWRKPFMWVRRWVFKR